MKPQLLSEKYSDQLFGTLSWFDRTIVSGNVQPWCYDRGMTKYFYVHGIRLFGYNRFVLPLCDAVRANAEAIAEEHGREIEFTRKHKAFRKEDRINEVLQTHGDRPGLVHVFSAIETCSAYYPWHHKGTRETFLQARTGKCLHYYSYFIDEDCLCLISLLLVQGFDW